MGNGFRRKSIYEEVDSQARTRYIAQKKDEDDYYVVRGRSMTETKAQFYLSLVIKSESEGDTLVLREWLARGMMLLTREVSVGTLRRYEIPYRIQVLPGYVKNNFDLSDLDKGTRSLG